jgi:hypothetical protein
VPPGTTQRGARQLPVGSLCFVRVGTCKGRRGASAASAALFKLRCVLRQVESYLLLCSRAVFLLRPHAAKCNTVF